MIYAFSVHWLIAPVYFLTVPLLGVLSSVLSRRIKTDPEGHRRRDDGAGRLDDRVAAQHRAGEEPRPRRSRRSSGSTRTTDKILKLELKKVRYLRSLSFIQGTAVNLLRTSILFLMLYLIFTRAITVGQFFSLFIYSFFIFGPLQELGNIINIYRETEASLQRLRGHPARCRRSRGRRNPVPLDDLRTLAFEHVTFQHQSASSPARQRHLVRRRSAARRSRSSVRRAPARRRWSSCWSGSISRRPGDILYNGVAGDRDRPRRAARAHRLRHAGRAALLRHDSREPALREPGARPTRSASTCCARRRATACWRAPTAASTR